MEGVRMDEPFYDVVEYLPPNFWNKTKNEPFIQELMSLVFPETTWEPGNPDCQAKWWIWDVGTDHRASVRLDERSLASGEYPYCILKPPLPDSNTTGSG